MDTIKTFDALKVARDGYKTKYDKLDKKHTAMIAEIKNNYRGKLLQEQLAAEKKQHEDDLEKARQEARTFAIDALEQLRTDEITRASRLPDARIQLLQSLIDVPMTGSELNALKSRFGTDYWTEKMFSYMAERNGIQQEIKPTLDDKLSILQDAEKAINDYIDDYTGADSTYTTLAAISDGQIMSWEKAYTSNYDGIKMSPRQRAEHIAALVLSEPNVTSAGLRLKNMISDMDDWTKTQFLEIFEEKGGNTDILAWAGLSQAMTNFEANEWEPLTKAREIVENAKKYDDKTTAAAYLDTVPEDCRSFVSNLLSEAIATTDNTTLAAACELSDVPEFQKLAEPQKLA